MMSVFMIFKDRYGNFCLQFYFDIYKCFLVFRFRFDRLWYINYRCIMYKGQEYIECDIYI